MEKNTETWKSLLVLGNQAFRQENWTRALHYYHQASLNTYENSRSLKNDISEPQIASILVCHFNIADTHLRLGQTQEACEQFGRCFRFLEPIVVNTPNNAIGLQAFSRCLSEWTTFKNASNGVNDLHDPPEINQIKHQLERTQTCH